MIAAVDDRHLTPSVTPHGRLLAQRAQEAPELEAGLARRLSAAFALGPGHGLLQLGAVEIGQALPPTWAFWREFAVRFVAAACTQPEAESQQPELISPPDDDVLDALAEAVPIMPGAEYLDARLLAALWQALGVAFAARLAESKAPLQAFLASLNPVWHVVGRVHFNLAENPRDEQAPFAFLATYTHRLSVHGKAQHLPLGQALRDYAGAARRKQLLALLLPVQQASESCAWLRALVDAGEIFHPLRWSAQEALRFLDDVPQFERAGIVVRLPAKWKAGRPARPQITATLGDQAPSTLGAGALLDFQVELTLDGEPLSASETRTILAASSGLALIRGRWVEIDRERLARTLEHFRAAERLVAGGGLSFGEALRTLAGADITAAEGVAAADREWSQVVAGPWLAQTLARLRAPEALAQLDPGDALRGTLRPYQQVGLRWLHLLSQLGLGACLADDMGLGKTIQVLSLLLVLKAQQPARPSLLVAPASLLANWAAEIERFTPSLRACIAHPSVMPRERLNAISGEELQALDLVITSYGTLTRAPRLTENRWRLAILDEAQAIKNPDTRQTRAVKMLVADARLALTGTPIENRLGDLWSLFDFINPGLLGSARQFGAYTRRLTQRSEASYAPLRSLVRPYILRRLKTDRRVIADLPDKTEVKAFCALSRKQAVLYQQAVTELAEQLRDSTGIQRRGLVLAFLTRFKQICNHPSHWLGDGAWDKGDSGKWARLRELAEVIADKQEKALVFTQFRELTAPLAAFLGDVFGRAGLVLHGGTAVRQRQHLVERFQNDESVPFFVLSLKAGGSGLNLTAASHVVHFDRWWNPAVENQATDRAFRIGQVKNVLVHKFVCRGTIEERIDALIESKQQLARELLEGSEELNLTTMGDDELLRLVALDLNAALED